MIAASPRLDDLMSFIRKVPNFPISAGDVARIAKDGGADSEVVKFYQAFPDNAVFDDQDDLLVRTESIEIMNRDEQPKEILTAPEED